MNFQARARCLLTYISHAFKFAISITRTFRLQQNQMLVPCIRLNLYIGGQIPLPVTVYFRLTVDVGLVGVSFRNAACKIIPAKISKVIRTTDNNELYNMA